MHTFLTTACLLCITTIFINNNSERWNSRDLNEFLIIQDGNRCMVNEQMPCIKKFIKEDFDIKGVRHYKVICSPYEKVCE